MRALSRTRSLSRTRARLRADAATLAVLPLLLLGLAGCSTVPTPGFPDGPASTRVSAPPTIVHVTPPWAPKLIRGPVPGVGGGSGATGPTDPAALARAKRWIVSAAPPPGVHALDAAPAGAPAEPAQSVACDWLVRATTWWSTASANAEAAKAWLAAHPVTGLVASGSMTGPGALSAVIEISPNSPNDSIDFEFAPDGDTTTIRVDVTVVPAGAQCASSGSAAVG